MQCFAAEANGNDLSRRGSSRTIMRGSFRWGRTFQVNLPLRFQSPRACHSRDITAPPYWKGTKKKVKFSQGKGPCSFILSSYPFAFRRKQNTCMQSQSLPNRTAMVSPAPAASNSRLSTALCSRQETPEKGPLVGVVAKVLPTSYRCSTQEQDLLHYRIQEQHCIFSSAIYRYFTWELLVCVQSPFILN